MVVDQCFNATAATGLQMLPNVVLQVVNQADNLAACGDNDDDDG